MSAPPESRPTPTTPAPRGRWRGSRATVDPGYAAALAAATGLRPRAAAAPPRGDRDDLDDLAALDELAGLLDDPTGEAEQARLAELDALSALADAGDARAEDHPRAPFGVALEADQLQHTDSGGQPHRVPVAVAACAWVRGASGPAGAAAVGLGLVMRLLPGVGLVPALSLAAGAVGALLLVVWVALGSLSPTAVREEEHTLLLPLDGHWDVVDDAAPGQGNHAYGQTWALGLAVAEPLTAPAAGEGLPARCARALGLLPAHESATFGQPVRAMADATVVRVVDDVRDHRTRSTRPARALAAVGGALRELCGARAVLGNHVVLDLGGGRYAVCAHLQRHSAVVQVGERVLPGDLLAACGSSGATNSPHLHVQVMDSPHARTAAGLPMRLVATGRPCTAR